MTHYASSLPRWLTRLLHVAHRIFPRPSPPQNRAYCFQKSGLPFFKIRPTVFKNWAYRFSKSS